MFNKLALGVVAIAIVAGVVFFFTNTAKHDDAMQKEGSAMDQEKDKQAMMQKEEGSAIMKDDAVMKKDDAMMAHTGSYIPYSEGKLALAAKGPVILFFHASWCPTCIGLDKDIKAHLKDIPENVTILDVDYDSSQALKQKYGVTIQHTLVQVDASGTLLKKWQGSPTLATFLQEVQK